MSPRFAARAALVLVAPLTFQACATKGFVRTQIATVRVATDSAIAAERQERIAADNDMAARIAALRTDLDGLRKEFGVKIAAMEGALKFVMPVNFAFDDATVTAEARPMLERFARVAKAYYPNSAITIEGFADPAGSEQYNLQLSRERAENVQRSLRSFGRSGPTRVIGYGESRQVNQGAAKNDPGARANRRVVFVIESTGSDGLVALGPSTR